MNSLILLAGGSGTRAQQKIPKQFIELDGKQKKRLMYLQYPYLRNMKLTRIVLESLFLFKVQ